MKTNGPWTHKILHPQAESEKLRLAVEECARLREEVEDLKSWKESAMVVMTEIDLQKCGKLMNLPLGTNIGPHIAPSLERLAAIRAALGIDKTHS